MNIRHWLDNAVEAFDSADVHLRVILKSGNELDVVWYEDSDRFGDKDLLTNGDYMIDLRSVAAVQLLD